MQQPLFLYQRWVGPAKVEAVGWQGKVGRQADADALWIDVHRGRGLHRVGQCLERDPATRVTRQRVAVHAKVDVFLHAGRCQHRHHHRLEEVIGLVWQGGRLGGVIVTGNDQHPAMLRTAGGVGVAEHITAAIHPGPLAVPHREHPIDGGRG
ncbi:hypothetical protein SDC9_175214 [bioreactor metagenome]|uniref:Uncharacterized protein n=1 Tax=bioreactor metagenome TaxID=1076179 RepID=A0A645GNL5_9ZZZZ